MKEIALYLEGGGDAAQQKAELRTGMDALLGPQKQAAREKKLGWRLVPCGGRQKTFGAFDVASRRAGADTLVVLLVDSEDPLPPESKREEADAKARVQHLSQRENWSLSGLDPRQVHLMVQCMEAWIAADTEAIVAYYGQGFHAKSLPNRSNLEEEPKAALLNKLTKATQNTQKKEYAKIKHASNYWNRSTR